MKLFKNSAIVKAVASMILFIIIVATISLRLSISAPHVHADDTLNVTEFSLSTNSHYFGGITNGPDGSIWFTEDYDTGERKIGRITPSGTITEFPLPTDIYQVYGITNGSDGNLWFTETTLSQGYRIVKMTPSGVIVAEFPLPTDTSQAYQITSGPDGNLWFTEPSNNKIGRITPAGTATEFPLPTTGNNGSNFITNGPDGNIWFTVVYPAIVGKITPSGNVTEFSLPTSDNNSPSSITNGPDGNIWFTANSDKGRIGKMTPSGAVTEYSIPSGNVPTGSAEDGIIKGPDGNLWFAEPNGNRIGRITPSGSITEFLLSLSTAQPRKMISGPDGNLWFTDGNGNIGRVNLSSTPTPKPQTYLALGDSYSSGEGNPPFRADMDCHRSYDAWPYLLAKSDPRLWLLGNYACTGAKASNALTQSYNPCSLLFQFRKCPQAPQISVMKSLKPDIVTITIGGNDIGFASTIRGCYLEGIAHRQNLCVDRLYSQVAVIKSFGKNAVGYYKEIKAALPGKSKLYIVGYPNIFPTNQKDTIHCGWLSNAGRAEFNALAILLDKVLHDAANTAGVNYVSTLYALKGHELCTSSSWVNPIVSKHGPPEVTSDAHPTLAGQQAIETFVDKYIN